MPLMAEMQKNMHTLMNLKLFAHCETQFTRCAA